MTHAQQGVTRRSRGRASGPIAPGSRRARRDAEISDRGFEHALGALGTLAQAGVRVSARLNDLATGEPLLRVDDYFVAQTGSIGKVLLLIEAAVRCDGGPGPMLVREPGDAAAGAGLWQSLTQDRLPMADVAALIGAHNDHLASNVLLRQVGLEAMAQRAQDLKLRHTRLLDGVSARWDLPGRAALSRSTMTELSELFWRLDRGEIVSPEISARVVGWIRGGADLGMIAGALGLNPLSHGIPSYGLEAYAMVTRDRGLRAEAGVVRGERAGVCYSVKAAFTEDNLSSGYAVQETLRTVGLDLLEYVSA
ncbi:serine hydrolase [Mycetocola spongiae]|uniref:serine hydrolase n=1 Tax=Mycetocola spongiae TaxID=2859226 RepID=UPI001CF5DCB3|nr:serine hydrolase [Mycetocola spongiae]UCR88205.1 class A beta-lactamase-related serine hydrolase [Mycetocola spongiae]